jgi:deoxyribodipyrimidine photolyase-related protein
MAELVNEAHYVAHHKQKIVLVFSAMRHFAEQLRQSGRTVHYFAYGDTPQLYSFTETLNHMQGVKNYQRLMVTEPGEYRLKEEFAAWSGTPALDILPDDRFLADHQQFQTWADGRKQLRMEFFYRDMRRQTGLLMDGDQPVGGQWNYDSDNRKKLPRGHVLPPRLRAETDTLTAQVMALVEENFASHMGNLDRFDWPVTAQQAEAHLAHFLDVCLPQFGDYQDAMKQGEVFLYHSLIASSLNLGLLDPLKICQAAELRWQQGLAPLNAVEGFIRQIIGWREFIRGIYWLKMPHYETSNYFEHNRKLPEFYYSSDTDMACMKDAIVATQNHAYAHHIQRLMITGNFALLAGLAPAEVNQWYLEVYADAYQWVQLPNTHGMALFADGGVVGSKPYAASGAYINRMSDHCSGCRYDVKQREGEDACPFNYLYWDFMMRHEDKLGDNPRMGMVYRNLQKMDDTRKSDVRASATKFLEQLK